MSSVKAQANIAYAMSKADRMNVHELTFDVANVNHSGPLTPSHVPAPSENRPEVQVGPPVESLVDRHLESVRGLESTQPELSREVAASHVAPAASMVDKHLQNIENTVELAAPQIELDVDR